VFLLQQHRCDSHRRIRESKVNDRNRRGLVLAVGNSWRFNWKVATTPQKDDNVGKEEKHNNGHQP